MHIPDGFLDLKTSLAADALSVGALTLALRDARRTLPPRRVPLLGLAAAFIFAGQMLNFPVAGGTSGHLVGSVLAAALLGPGAAVIALTAVLVVQCFVFADGGVLALGANIFNMGVIGALVGYALYRLVYRQLGGRVARGGGGGGVRQLGEHGAGGGVLRRGVGGGGDGAVEGGVPGDGGRAHVHRRRRGGDHHAGLGGGWAGAPGIVVRAGAVGGGTQRV